MYFKKIEDESGPYADAHGRRYDVAGARRVRSSSMEYSDYEEFESLEEALCEWGLFVSKFSNSPRCGEL